MTIPSIKLIATNFTSVEIGNIQLFFSYNQLVAVFVNGEQFISENIFSVTTGKHINMLSSDKSIRLSRLDFLKKVENI